MQSCKTWAPRMINLNIYSGCNSPTRHSIKAVFSPVVLVGSSGNRGVLCALIPADRLQRFEIYHLPVRREILSFFPLEKKGSVVFCSVHFRGFFVKEELIKLIFPGNENLRPIRVRR